MKISRYAIPIALGAGVVVFAVAFLLLSQGSWSPLLTLGVAAVLFILTSFGVWLILDNRSGKQLEIEAYRMQADLKVTEVHRTITEIGQYAAQIRARQTANLVRQGCSDGEALLARIREKNPNTLLSSATELGGVLEDVKLLLDKYVDIQDNPRYYEDAPLKLQEGQTAIAGFAEFILKSIQQAERGETLRYDVARKMLEAKKFTRLT